MTMPLSNLLRRLIAFLLLSLAYLYCDNTAGKLVVGFTTSCSVLVVLSKMWSRGYQTQEQLKYLEINVATSIRSKVLICHTMWQRLKRFATSTCNENHIIPQWFLPYKGYKLMCMWSYSYLLCVSYVSFCSHDQQKLFENWKLKL